MNAASTSVALQTLLPRDRLASRNQSASKTRAAKPDKKNIGIRVVDIGFPR
jgi:hypothetical protein